MQFLTFVLTWLQAHVRVRSERGQDLIEYAMLGGLIALAIISVGYLAFQGPLSSMAAGIGRCIDFDNTTNCDPF
jgi:Flp pilus assembly pilin Flp